MAKTKKVITKKINIMASADWSMRAALVEFDKFLNRDIKWKNKTYKVEYGRVIAEPIKCGDNLAENCDLLVDRTIHWNNYYKCWAQSASNSSVQHVNNCVSYDNLDKHASYDLMARAMHPEDRFPTTVLLPQFAAYTEEGEKAEMWAYEQSLITKHTKFGWDENRRTTDWDKVKETLDRTEHFQEMHKVLRNQFYAQGNYIQESMEKHFNNQYPVYLKKAFGGGGSDVFKVNSLEELYAKYDETGGKVFHIQESIENFDEFVRCMAIGPQVLPMRYVPEAPLHQHYSEDKLRLDAGINDRLYNYVNFINSYHRWTYNSFEALIRDDVIHPIDFANACPDSNFTSLHVHFPWLICALTKWLTFCAVAEKDMKIDLEQAKYRKVLNDPKLSQQEKYDFCAKKNEEYFEIEKFEQFCEENFSDIDDRMIEFYDESFDEIIAYSIKMSDFPKEEHERFYWEYKNTMDQKFRPNAKEYLSTYINK